MGVTKRERNANHQVLLRTHHWLTGEIMRRGGNGTRLLREKDRDLSWNRKRRLTTTDTPVPKQRNTAASLSVSGPVQHSEKHLTLMPLHH